MGEKKPTTPLAPEEKIELKKKKKNQLSSFWQPASSPLFGWGRQCCQIVQKKQSLVFFGGGTKRQTDNVITWLIFLAKLVDL